MSWIVFRRKLLLKYRNVTLSPSALPFLFSILLALCLGSSSQAAGPLTINTGNPRFFIDSNGRAVYLVGAHLNNSLVDSDKSAVDFTTYLKLLQQYDHNFMRLWAWEQSAWIDEGNTKIRSDPFPYLRSGPGTALDGSRKYDLTRFNQPYFDRLRSRVAEAGEHGIYVSVMLFQGLNSPRDTTGGGNPWNGHPFNLNNNVNGINGDPADSGNGEEIFSMTLPAITSLQETYVRKVVDTLNDLDNVLYEISGDAPLSSREWQYYMVDYLKGYQMTKPKQHPVGMSYLYLGTVEDLLASPAEWILLPGTDPNPPLATGDKVILSDMNPKLLEDRMSYQIAWKSFMRGLNPIYLESDLRKPHAHESVRHSMGDTRRYSQLVDLSSMVPNSELLCSTGYCLINSGREYLIYLPVGGTIRVDLSDATGNFVASWFNPLNGETTPGGTISAGGPVVLSSPIKGDAVLYVQAMAPLSTQTSDASAGLTSVGTNASLTSTFPTDSSVAAPTITPNGGAFNHPVPVTLQTTTSGASIFYTTDGSDPTPSSQPYTGSFVLTGTSLVKAQAFKSGSPPSASASAWFTMDMSSDAIILTSASADEVLSNAATLTWTDNSNSEDGFRIQRKTGTNGTFAQIAAVAANITSYTDSGLTVGNTYCYRVSAFNSAGASAYTNEACKTISATAAFNFSLTNGGNKSVIRGQSVSNSITATLSAGTSQSVSFSTSGLPSGTTASYSSSTSCTPTCSRTLNIATTTSTPTGTYTVTVTASGGGVNKTTTFNLTVSSSTSSTFDFSLSNDGKKSVTRGKAVSSAITATLSSGTSQSVSFSTSGLPSGTTASYSSSTSCTPTCSRTLNIATTTSTPPGSYTITVTGTSSSGVKRTTSFTLNVQYFSLSNGGNKSVTRGQSVSNTITATLNGQASQAISFSTSGLPSGTTASYSSSNSCTPSCSRTLNIKTATSTPVGTYTITVTGTGTGGIKRTTSFSLAVK